MKIRIYWYANGETKTDTTTEDSIESAYTELKRIDTYANVWPEGTKEGLFSWRPNQDYTLKMFTKHMNDIASRGL